MGTEGLLYPSTIQATFTALVGAVVSLIVRDPVTGTAFATATAPASVCSVARIVELAATPAKVTLTLVVLAATLARPLRENETLPATSSALPEVLSPSLAHVHRSWVSLREHFRKAHQREQPRIRGAVSAFRGAPDEPRPRHTP